MKLATQSLGEAHPANHPGRLADQTPNSGFLMVNADDWGRDCLTTNRILECCASGAVSSVSAMVFMEDSERAAAFACERGIEVGLHLNLTDRFSATGCSARLLEQQQQISRHLRRHRLSQIAFHPGLMRSFEYVVAAQLDEFRRIYGTAPEKLDGHHHMHLCANVLIQRLLPAGTIVRRNFSLQKGEKSVWNHLYRKILDRKLARRHRLADFFYSLFPIEPNRLQRIYVLARRFVVELETHPVQAAEYSYLAAGEIFRQIGDVRIAAPSAVPWARRTAKEEHK